MATMIGDKNFCCPHCGGDTIRVMAFSPVFAVATEFSDDPEDCYLCDMEEDWAMDEYARLKEPYPECSCTGCEQELRIEDLPRYVKDPGREGSERFEGGEGDEDE